MYALRMRKTFAVAVVLLAGCGFASAQGYHYNDGYTSKSGAYVPGHYQTNPNGTTSDNWSTKGNQNPFTGQPGYVSPYRPPAFTPSYTPSYTPYAPYTPRRSAW